MNTVVITGSNGGIGSEICNFFKSKGWNVIGLDLQKTSYNKYADIYYKINLTKSGDIKKLFKNIKNIPNIKCFINCAAYQCCKPIWKYTEKEWDNSYNCNVKSLFLIVKFGLNIFKKYETNIINISSIHSQATSKHISAYASSKAAIVGLTKNMAIDLSEFNIRVNSISPGAVNTTMLREHLSNEKLDYLQSKHLLNKIGEPIQIAETCFFINNNTFFNGNNVIIDGGVLSQLSSE